MPAWQPHPEVWLVMALALAGYFVALTRLGPVHAPVGRPAASRLQIVSFTTAVLALLVVSVWPIHDVSEQRLFSVHMVQHLVEMLIAPPLVLVGIPAWMARLVVPAGLPLRMARWVCRFLPALVVFNVVLVGTHVPFMMEWQLSSGWAHFVVHGLAFLAGLVMWMPVLSPLPEVPRLAPPLAMLYLFLQGVVPTLPASFLTFGQEPLYGVYEGFPRMGGLSPLEDMQVGGLIMKIGAGIVLWVLIAVIFFRWYAEEEDRDVPGHIEAALDRELAQMGLTNG